ncbi:MAG: 2-oxo-4-hydroxy-4-carboxy-5-ureidoimidazoline decarboxylase, partial [Pseudomonadota bacterium]
DQFENYLRDSFDCLYAEGQAGWPKMMSVGLHCRLMGRPGRVMALKRFLDYAQGHEGVWFATRAQIADHWAHHHPPKRKVRFSALSRDEFVNICGGLFEHSPWVAQAAYDAERSPAIDNALGLHAALCLQFRLADDDQKLAVLTAHPDLAGKLATAKRLTKESAEEQASARLNALTDMERATFTDLNTAYVKKFGFPFIIAVRDYTKASILKAFQSRLENDRVDEFETACRQVERIVWYRIQRLIS